METFLADVRYAIRGLMKARGFTAVALITLAVGAGCERGNVQRGELGAAQALAISRSAAISRAQRI